jgi:hypothetical protein
LQSTKRRVVRAVEGARLESVYASQGYREFESLTLRITKMDRKIDKAVRLRAALFILRLPFLQSGQYKPG